EWWPWSPRRSLTVGWSRAGKLDMERRPPARRAFHRDGAAHLARVLAHDPEAEPEPAASLPSADLSELFKDPRLVLGRDSRPRVTHGQQSPITVLLDDHLDRRPARMRERVGEKVRSEEHTSELQSRGHLVCRLLLEKKKNTTQPQTARA